MRAARVAVAFVVLTWHASGSATAAKYAQETLDRYFRIEYQVAPSGTRPVISGYVYNMHPGMPVERMQLAIEALDSSGNVVGTSSTWVLGTVPAGNRAYFSAPAPAAPAASYRVQVLLFDWGTRSGSSN